MILWVIDSIYIANAILRLSPERASVYIRRAIEFSRRISGMFLAVFVINPVFLEASSIDVLQYQIRFNQVQSVYCQGASLRYHS